MNNESFLIEELDLETAKDLCKFIENPVLRNRAAANNAAAIFAKKYFQDYEADIETGLHNICKIAEDIEISDIYIKDNYIDVRLYFNDNELFIPKSTFDKGIIPVAYMFIKVSEELTDGLVTGFILPASVDTSKEYEGYYKVSEEDLVSLYDVENNLITKYNDDLPQDFEEKVFDYLDGKLDDIDGFYKFLTESRDARILLKNASLAKTVFNFVSIPDEIKTESYNEQESDILQEPEEETFLLENNADTEDEVLVLEESEELSDVSDDMINLTFEDNTLEENIESLDLEDTQTEDDITGFSEEVDLSNENFEILEETEIEEENETTQDLSESIEELVLDEEPEENIKENIEDIETIEKPVYEPVPDTTEEQEDEFKSFTEIEDYSTNITPSLDFNEEKQEDELTEEALEQNFETEEESAEDVSSDNSEEIDTLFNQNSEEVKPVTSKPKNLLIPVLSAVVVAGIIGYYSYTKFFAAQQTTSTVEETAQTPMQTETEETNENIEVAMPVETVENMKIQLATNEGTAVSVPAIEQNLDASIAVENLRVEFEIPSGYKSAKTAERYFTKMGRIIQMYLKRELLLLTKQPVTNKIAIELQYNQSTHKFEAKGLLSSSGEKTIDDLIMQTVRNALDINLNMNMNTFNNAQGNPVLIIKL